MNKQMYWLGVVVAVASLTGCQAPARTANGSLDAVFTVTRAIVGPDGSFHVVGSFTETRAEQLTQRNKSANSSIQPDTVLDTTCADSDMWIYDQGRLQGNRLCLAGTGAVALSKFMYPIIGTWNERAKSFWAGVGPGDFYSTLTGQINFTAYEQFEGDGDGDMQAGPVLELEQNININ